MKLIHPQVICIHCNSTMEFWGSSEYAPEILSFACKICPNPVKQNFLLKSHYEPQNNPVSVRYSLDKLISHNIIINNYTFALFPEHQQLRIFHHLGNTVPSYQKWEFFNNISLTHEFAQKFISRIQKLKSFL